jgi:CDP-glycerol glycerophosphotransferase
MKLIFWIKKIVTYLIIYSFNCLPIKHNKIFLFSYYGSQYGCNPKYITEYILQNYPKGKFDIVWAFHDLDAKAHLHQIRKVKTMSLRYFYELCTSKVIITNYRTTEFFVKRKNQYYIQTWHSSLRLKQIEKDAASTLPKNYIEMAKKDSLKCDLLLSGSQCSTEIFKRAFWYNGEIMERGSPRNDILVQRDKHREQEIKNELYIPCEKKILLYAPTFRNDNQLHIYQLDFKRIVGMLTKKFGGDWVVLVKLHPHLKNQSKNLLLDEGIYDVTNYDDMQELLLVADVLISDYSSLIFDYAITHRPCFLYVPDLHTYIKKERNLYFDIIELPFISALSQDSLLTKIEQFQKLDYIKNVNIFLQKIGSYDHGEACKNVADRLLNICFNQERGKGYEAV